MNGGEWNKYISDFNANSISTFKGKILLGKQGCIYDH